MVSHLSPWLSAGLTGRQSSHWAMHLDHSLQNVAEIGRYKTKL